MLLILVREGLTILWEAADISDLDILTAFLESFFNVALHIEDFLLHRRIPVVLNGIVSSTLQIRSNDSPFVLQSAVQDVENEFLFLTPFVLLNFWVKMVVPSLTALLSNAPRQVVSDVSPFHRASGLDKR